MTNTPFDLQSKKDNKGLNMELVKKTLLPLLLVLIVGCSWLNPFDSLAIEKVDAGLKRAMISYGVVMAIDAAVSVVQKSEIGIGVKFALGEALDPVNDLVEKASNLIFAACVSLGIQRVLLSIGSHWVMSALLSITTFLWIFIYLRGVSIPVLLKKMLLITIVLRFCLPTVTLGTEVLFQLFLEKDYSASQKAIEATAADVGVNTLPSALPENAGLWEKTKNLSLQDVNVIDPAGRSFHAAYLTRGSWK